MANLKFDGRWGGPQELIETPQTLTDQWANLNDELEVGGASALSLWLNIDINDSKDPRVRVLAKHQAGGSEEYAIPTFSTTSQAVRIVNREMIEIDSDTDQKIILTWLLSGSLPYVQFQVEVGTVGSTAGQILTAYAMTAL